MEIITTANGIIALITGLLGLIGTGIGTYFAVKNWITAMKTKNSQEIWTMIMEIADSSMREAEASMQDGETKKQIVKAAGINVDLFLDQLSNYIDSTIKFVNDMKK